MIFNRPDPRAIFVGAVRLDVHLKAMGTCQALEIRTLLAEQSWEAFERQYKPGGPSPYAPQAILGLILYGIFNGVSSLRGLEALARVDLGCMWITGGLCPDDAAIGRFIQRHDAQLTGEFRDGLTRTGLRSPAAGSTASPGTAPWCRRPPRSTTP